MIDWAESADNDLMMILDHFRNAGEKEAGKAIVKRLVKSVDHLAWQPLAGRKGRIAETRELVPRKLPYILVYQTPVPGKVEIVRVLHTSRLFPETLFEHQEDIE